MFKWLFNKEISQAMQQQIDTIPMDETERLELKKLSEDIAIADSVKKQVSLYAKIMDDFGVDMLIWLIPELWDIGTSLVSSIFFIIQAQRLGLSFGDQMKIVAIQAGDVLAGVVPWLDIVTDYLFKGNNRSADIFADHLEELEKKARDNGISEDQIAQIKADNTKFIAKAHDFYDKWIAATKNLQSQTTTS